MDKAYTMMYEVDSKGRIAGNEFTDYSSVETIQQSFNLKVPKRENVIEILNEGPVDVEGRVSLDDIFLQLFGVDVATYEVNQPIGTQFLNDIQTILNKLSNNVYYIGESELVSRLNKYNKGRESSAAMRNRIMNGIYTASSDLNNLQASQVPMEMKPITKIIDFYYEQKMANENVDTSLNDFDMFTIWKIQKENAVGKKDVGISANGLKAIGAIQQFYNRHYAEQAKDPKNLVNSNVDLDIELHWTINDRQINDHIFKLPNTKMTKEVWEAQYNRVFNLNKEHPLKQIFNAWESGMIQRDKLSPKELAYLKIYELWKRDSLRVFNDDAFKDFLYFTDNFQPNVADMLSIFVSMSTDNAKTLALAKMNGRPELLSLPLAMVSIGMHIDDVINICVNVLDPLVKQIDNGVTDIRKAIEKLISGAQTPEEKQNYESLLKIFDIAQELRAITSFFKVNQGIKPRYVELEVFLTNLSKQKIQAAQQKGRADLAIPFNFHLLFHQNPETRQKYQKQMLDEYDQVKTCFNVMEIVLGSPNFSKQLESIALTNDFIQSFSGKAFLAASILQDGESILQVVEDNSENVEEKDDEYLSGDKLLLPNTTSGQLKYSQKLLRLIDDYVIQRGLEKASDLSFSIESVQNAYPEYESTLDKGTTLGVHTPYRVNEFLTFMEDFMIPKFQKMYPKNFFFKHLHPVNDWATKRSYLDLEYDSFLAAQDKSLAANLDVAENAFKEVAEQTSGIKTISGRVLTVGELMYLYNVITTRNAIKGSTSCIYSYAKYKSDITTYIDDEYIYLDSVVQLATSVQRKLTEEDAEKNEFLKPIYAAQQELNTWKNIIYPKALALNTPSGIHMDTATEITTTLYGSYLQTMSPTLYPEKIRMNNLKPVIQKEIGPIYGVELIWKDGEDNDRKDLTIKIQNPIQLNGQNIISIINTTVEFLKSSQGFSDSISGDSVQLILDDIKKAVLPLSDILSESKNIGTYKENISIKDILIEGQKSKDELELSFIGENGYSNKDKEIAKLLLDTMNEKFDYIVKLHPSSETLTHIEFYTVEDENHIQRQVPVLIFNERQFRNGILGNKIGNETLATLVKLRTSLEFQSESTPSNELLYILRQLTGKNVEFDQVQTILKDKNYKETLQKSKFFQKVSEYEILDSVNSYIESQANMALQKFNIPLQQKEIYYNDSIVDLQSNYKDFREGDIYEYSNGFVSAQYLYIGDSLDGRDIFIKLTNLDKPQSKFLQITRNRNVFKRRVGRLKVNANYRLDYIKDVNLNEYDQPTGKKLDQIRKGDIIVKTLTENDVQYYYVLDVIFDKDFTGTYQKQLVTQYIQPGSKYKIDPILLLETKQNVQFAVMSYSHVTTSSAVRTTLVDLSKVDADTKTNLIKSLHTGDKIKYTNSLGMPQIGIIQVKYDNETFQTDENQIITSDKLLEVNVNNLFRRNQNFEHIARTGGIEISTKVWNKMSEKQKIDYINTFTFGKVSIEKRGNKSILIIPDFSPYSIPDYNFIGKISKASTLHIGDVIEDVSEIGIHTLYKIIGRDGDMYTLLDSSSDSKEPIQQYHISDLQNKRSYRYYTDTADRVTIDTSNMSQDTITSLETMGQDFLLALADKFGTTVKIVQDNTLQYLASVQDGQVIINLAKKPNNIGLGTYIMEQAVHEFTHLMLSYLRAKYPTLYYRLINDISKVLPEALLISETEPEYTSDYEKAEEAIVHMVQNYYNTKAKDTVQVDLLKDIVEGFNVLFGRTTIQALNSSGSQFNMQMQFAIPKNFLSDKTEPSDLQTIRRSRLSEEFLKNITYKCE